MVFEVFTLLVLAPTELGILSRCCGKAFYGVEFPNSVESCKALVVVHSSILNPVIYSNIYFLHELSTEPRLAQSRHSPCHHEAYGPWEERAIESKHK